MHQKEWQILELLELQDYCQDLVERRTARVEAEEVSLGYILKGCIFHNIQTFIKGNAEKWKGIKQENDMIRFSFQKADSLDIKLDGIKNRYLENSLRKDCNGLGSR